MAHYKIKNITNNLPKRHVDKDRVLKVEYHVGFQKKFREVYPNEEILMTCRTLPVSIHGLRAKKLITVSEISENEFIRLQKPSSKIPKMQKPNLELEKKESELEEINKTSSSDDDQDETEESSEETSEEDSTKKSTTKKTTSRKRRSTTKKEE